MSNLPIVQHWIDGAEYASKSGRTSPVYDPALGVQFKPQYPQRRKHFLHGAIYLSLAGRQYCLTFVNYLMHVSLSLPRSSQVNMEKYYLMRLEKFLEDKKLSNLLVVSPTY